jgi:hypothetical protein
MTQGNYLDRFSKIVTLSLLLNDRLKKKGIHCLQAQVKTSKHFPGGDAHLINLSSGNVIFPRQSDIQETLIVS